MVLHAEQIFDKVYLDRELINKLIDQLEDHKPRCVVLKEPGFIEDLPGSQWDQKSAYKQDLECIKIVQCKNCRMHFPWCHKFKSELGGNGFCPYGKEIGDGK